jgi:hypothetical protein
MDMWDCFHVIRMRNGWTGENLLRVETRELPFVPQELKKPIEFLTHRQLQHGFFATLLDANNREFSFYRDMVVLDLKCGATIIKQVPFSEYMPTRRVETARHRPFDDPKALVPLPSTTQHMTMWFAIQGKRHMFVLSV